MKGRSFRRESPSGPGGEPLTNLHGERAQRSHVDLELPKHAARRAVSVVKKSQKQVRRVWGSRAESSRNFSNSSPEQLEIVRTSVINVTLPFIENSPKSCSVLV